MIAQQRCESAANTEIDPCLWILSVDPIHVVAFFVSDHFEGQFIMIAQKDSPLAVLRNRRCLLQNVHNGKTIFCVDSHKQTGHEREMKVHMAFISLPKVSRGILGPLISLSQEQAVLEFSVYMAA